ncbi:hypothetical protein PFISCL1PPCAC_24297, partial [Pristionchus fissidentatus]
FMILLFPLLLLLATSYSSSLNSTSTTTTTTSKPVPQVNSTTVTWIVTCVILVVALLIGSICYALRRRIPCFSVLKSIKEHAEKTDPANQKLRKTSSSQSISESSSGSEMSGGSGGPEVNDVTTEVKPTKRSRTMSNSLDEDVTSSGVKFINRRGDLALPFVPKETLRRIEKSFKSSKPLEGVATVDIAIKPVIKEVFTYSTSDDITLIEEIMPKKKKLLGLLGGSSKPTSLDEKELFLDLLRNGPRQFPFTRLQMKSILKRGKNLFKDEPSMLETAVPCIVYGDIHGQYSDLLRWLNMNGFPNEIRCVFLG